MICPADTDADLAACRTFVGAGPAAANLAGLTIVPSSVIGGQGATGTLTLTSPAPAGGAEATLSSDNPAAGVPPSVTVPEGQTSVSFPVTTTPVSSTTTATITATSTNTVSAGLTINPSGPATGTITGLIISPPSVTGGQGATGTVTLSAAAPAGGIPVSLASNNPAAGVPPSVNVPEGQSSASFPVTTSPVTSTTVATITATSANTASASLTITPPAPACVGALTLSTSDILGGLSLQGVVALTAKAGVGGQFVNLSSSSLAASVPVGVRVAEGQDRATFTINTNPVVFLTTPIISASAGACVAATASLRLLP